MKDIRQKINDGGYLNKIPFPDKNDYKSPCNCGCPNCTAIVYDKDGYDKAIKIYRENKSKIYNQFKHDALDDVGLLGHPKADIIYSKAWDRGHSSGLPEVLLHLEDLAELFD